MRTVPCHPSSRSRGFTLIEIMIVVSIMAIAMAIGIPSMFRMAEKDSLRQVVQDILEACQSARAQAILTGQTQELVVRPIDHTVSAPGKDIVRIPERVVIELLGVNFIELQQANEAHVRFFANSTSDEFTMVLRSDKNEMRKISLEVVTALPDVESDPTKFLR